VVWHSLNLLEFPKYFDGILACSFDHLKPI